MDKEVLDEAGAAALMNEDTAAEAEEPEEQESQVGKSQVEESEAEEAEGEEAEDESETGHKKLAPEIQRVIDARIGKEVGKRKAAEEARETAAAESAALKARLDGLTEQAISNMEVPPEYVEPAEATLLARDRQMTDFEEYVDSIRDQDPEDEVEVGGRKYTVKEVLARGRAVEREHRTVAVRADAVRQRALKELKADLAEGRRIRLARAKAAAAAKGGKQETRTTAGGVKLGTRAAPRTAGKSDPLKVFADKGSNMDAAAAALALM